ncbi:MAG: ATP-binding protein [Candidatus Competibacteraceae bacterium]|nr:ATP-binding protein [Candidatus Competibacteraceae bacterium]
MKDSLTVREPIATALNQAQQWLKPILERAQVPDSLGYEIDLIVEEILVNILTHGLTGTDNSHVEIRRRMEGNQLWLEFRDCGQPFDPLSVPDPDLEKDIEHRPIGGLGLYLVKQLADNLHYIRENNLNCLHIGKILSVPDTTPSTTTEL